MTRNLNELIRNINTNKLNKEQSEQLGTAHDSDDDDDDDDERAASTSNSNNSSSKATPTQLDGNSSTAEFKSYLNEVKRAYLDKLTFSCPSKLSATHHHHYYQQQQQQQQQKQQQRSTRDEDDGDEVEEEHASVYDTAAAFRRLAPNNINNSSNNKMPHLYHATTSKVPTTAKTPQRGAIDSAATLSARRSLLFDTSVAENKSNLAKSSFNLPSSNNYVDDVISAGSVSGAGAETSQQQQQPELTKTQILSRLVQIREYLKQSYGMLATLQTSNDLLNYSTQMSKLHSLIEHLKDQERGYMQLLDSFDRYQHMAATAVANPSSQIHQKSPLSRDVLDLSELNDSSSTQRYKII